MGNPTIDPSKKARGSNQEPLRQKEEKMQKPPQIIVIPQSMLAGQKSLLRLAPMPRNTSPLLSSTTSPSPLLSSATVSPLLSSSPRPVAAVVGSKRPAPSPSPPKDLLLDIKEEQKEDEAPARKRANLDHLSPEERMMRRKLKNRGAAQTARDKKKAATDSMAQKLAEAKARLQESLDANAQLLKTNTQLRVENANLQQKNIELQARLSPLCTLPLSPPSLPPALPCQQPKHPPVHRALASWDSSSHLCPSAAGTRQEHDATGQEFGPRVVVERLDSLGQSSGLDSGVCGAVGALPQAQPTPNLTLTFALSASSLEEETYPPVGLSLNTDIGFDLGDTLNTPTTNTTGSILDGFLADTEMMAMAESEKWEKSLDDLFPDLD